MKTFPQFIFECQVKEYIPLQELIAEATGRSGPKYNYEVALVNLYNHLIKSGNKANNNGKILRGLVSRGDTEELTDFLAQELNDAKNNEKHPLHFNNAGNEGFTGGKKTDDHRDSYYSELEDQFYTFLNDSQSNLGKKLISQGYAVKRLGDDSIPLSKSGKTAYGKESDTSKADIVFQHPTRPERENYSSLKKASGAVSASAGADETAGNYTVGMRSALQLALKSEIKRYEEKRQEIINSLISSGNEIASFGDEQRIPKDRKSENEVKVSKAQSVLNSIYNNNPGFDGILSQTFASGSHRFQEPGAQSDIAGDVPGTASVMVHTPEPGQKGREFAIEPISQTEPVQ
jgi:hypothetical protein